MGKIKNIEFLRFLFALMIIYAHILWLCVSVFKTYNNFPLYSDLHHNCYASFLCVEYFFIISGFFLFYNFKNKIESTFRFAVKKVIRLWPLLAFSIFLFLILSLFKMCDFHSYANVLNLLFLYKTGIDGSAVNNAHSWFVCIFFWCSIFYHYLYRNFDKKIVNLAIALMVFYSFSTILSATGGSFPAALKINSGISGALLRGFASIGLGYFLGMFWDKISRYIYIYIYIYIILKSRAKFYQVCHL